VSHVPSSVVTVFLLLLVFAAILLHLASVCVVVVLPVPVYAAIAVVLAEERFVAPCPSLSSDGLAAVNDPALFVVTALVPVSVVPVIEALPVLHEPELEILVVDLAAAAVVVVAVAVFLSALFLLR